MTRLMLPENHAVISVLTERQREFLAEDEHAYDEHKIDWAHLERMSVEDHTQPPKQIFSWETDEKESVLEIAEDADFQNIFRVICTSLHECEVCNFEVNKEYYWRVNGGDAFHFVTEDIAPRWIDAEGLTNVRDAGGWKTKDGRYIKQGLLFRGSEMDIHHTITENGKRTLCEDLKIKTDLDLRGEGLKLLQSPMGDDVKLVVIPVGPYHLFMQNYRKECKELFDFLCDESNYPIYYHCWGGADRTGTIAFLLGVILGMKEEDLTLDYELTSLAIWGDRSHKSELYQNFQKELCYYAGNTMSEQALNFLRSCGVTDEQMETLRKLFLVSKMEED